MIAPHTEKMLPNGSNVPKWLPNAPLWGETTLKQNVLCLRVFLSLSLSLYIYIYIYKWHACPGSYTEGSGVWEGGWEGVGSDLYAFLQ